MTPQFEAHSAQHSSAKMGNWVLVVEDDENIREVLRILFELEGFAAHWASTGEEALACLRETEESERSLPRLILVDGKLPDMVGPELVRVMRQKLPEECSVYLFSADPNFVQWGWRKGEISGFIHKPFDSDELVRLIQASLHSSHGLTTAPHAASAQFSMIS